MPKSSEVSKAEVDEIQDVPDWSVVAGLNHATAKVKIGDEKPVKMTIAEISARLVEIQQEEDKNKAEKDVLKAAGATLLVQAKVKSVMCDGVRTTRTSGSNKTIKRDLLLKYGVEEKTIEKATTVSEWTSLKVTAPKPKKEEEGE